MLDLSSLTKAVSSLERVLAFVALQNKRPEETSDVEKEVLAAAVVHHYLFTYELCWKFMRRWLEVNLSPGITAGLSRKQMFRLAAEHLLIEHIENWFQYHELRNLTSHTYDSETAAEILAAAPSFGVNARQLLTALESRND